MKLMTLLILTVLIGCCPDEAYQPEFTPAQAIANVEVEKSSVRGANGMSLKTITFTNKGHLFIVHDHGYGSTMLHHPACKHNAPN